MPGREVVLWNIIICDLVELEPCKETLELFLVMWVEILTVVPQKFASVVRALAILDEILIGNQWPACVAKLGLYEQPSVSCALFVVYGKCGLHIQEAQCVFDEMTHKTNVSFSTMIYSLASNGFYSESLQLILDVQKGCIHLNLDTLEYGLCFISGMDAYDLKHSKGPLQSKDCSVDYQIQHFLDQLKSSAMGCISRCPPKLKGRKYHLVAVNDIVFHPRLDTLVTRANEGSAINWGAQFLGVAPHKFHGAVEAMKKLREDPKVNVQYWPPLVIVDESGKLVESIPDGNVALTFNDRADRMVRIAKELECEVFDKFDRICVPKIHYVGIGEYDGELNSMTVKCLSHTFLLILSKMEASGAIVGIHLGTETSHWPTTTRTISVLHAQQIKHVHLYNAHQQVLNFFASAGIEMMVRVPKDQLLRTGRYQAEAARWLYQARRLCSLTVRFIKLRLSTVMASMLQSCSLKQNSPTLLIGNEAFTANLVHLSSNLLRLLPPDVYKIGGIGTVPFDQAATSFFGSALLVAEALMARPDVERGDDPWLYKLYEFLETGGTYHSNPRRHSDLQEGCIIINTTTVEYETKSPHFDNEEWPCLTDYLKNRITGAAQLFDANPAILCTAHPMDWFLIKQDQANKEVLLRLVELKVLIHWLGRPPEDTTLDLF